MKLGYVILYVPNVEGTLAFYEVAFGLSRRFVTDDGSYGELDTGSTTLSFASEELAGSHGFEFRPTRPDADPPAVEIALVTDDVDKAVAQAKLAGATVLAAPKDTPWGQRLAYIADVNGATVEICTPMSG